MITRPIAQLGRHDTAIAGGKGASLGELVRAGIPVPDGFVVLVGAFERFLAHAGIADEIDAELGAADPRDPRSVERVSGRIVAAIMGHELPRDMREEILRAFDALGARFVAVRSSATAEDGAHAAWAGQLETYLNTTRDGLADRVRQCWASLFSPRAIAYRIGPGARGERIGVAVVVQRMVESEVAGVAFSVHPVTEDAQRIIIEAALGLGESVVSGQVTPDSYVIGKADLLVVEKHVGAQERGLFRAQGGGSEWRGVAGERQKLPDDRIAELARLVVRIERHYGFPVDVEWAFAGGAFTILQSRPITTLGKGTAAAQGQKTGPEFEVVERLYNAPWLLVGYSSVGFVHDYPKLGGGSFVKHYVGTMESASDSRIVNEMLFVPAEFEEAAQHTARRLIHDDAWRRLRYAEFEAVASGYFGQGERLRRMDLPGLSDARLCEEAEKVLLLQHKVRTLGVLLNGVILDGRNHLSDMIRGELRAEIGGEGFDARWSLLTQVTGRRSARQEKLRELRLLKRSGGATPEKLQELHEKYCWLEYMYLGPASGIAQLREELERTDPDADPDAGMEETKRAQDALLSRIGASGRARALVDLAQGVLWQKGWRKDVEYHGCWCHEPLLRELAARKGEPDWRTIAFLLPWELGGFILGKGPGVDELRARREFSCIVVGPRGCALRSGDAARGILASLRIAAAGAAAGGEVRGQCAYKGTARGRVRIIHVPGEMGKMQEGDVLVSQATSPDLIEAMRKAGAIVTNTGGLICHAAITARELKIPCIVGTRNATEAFEDGDLVEVDAGAGVARKVS